MVINYNCIFSTFNTLYEWMKIDKQFALLLCKARPITLQSSHCYFVNLVLLLVKLALLLYEARPVTLY